MDFLKKTRRAILPAYQKYYSRLHELKFIFFELTHDCNLTCLHCGSDCVKGSGKEHLKQDDVLGVLKDIKGKYNSRKISVCLSGGEPLCYPDVFRLGRKIYELEFPWGMVTNGFAWNEKKIRMAKQSGMHSITVSLDGLEDTHEWLRGRRSSFNRAVNTIRLLLADRFWQAMDVITCVNSRNIDQLDGLYDLVKNLGLENWRFFIISPIGRATQVPELFLNKEQYHRLLNRILEFRSRGEINVALSESGYLGPQWELSVRNQYYFCRAGINIAGIMVNGDILACPNIDRRFAQGNIHKDTFTYVWENEYEKFRDRSWMKKGVCASCSEWKLCRGNSLHTWDLDENRPKICHYRDFGLDYPGGDGH